MSSRIRIQVFFDERRLARSVSTSSLLVWPFGTALLVSHVLFKAGLRRESLLDGRQRAVLAFGNLHTHGLGRGFAFLRRPAQFVGRHLQIYFAKLPLRTQ